VGNFDLFLKKMIVKNKSERRQLGERFPSVIASGFGQVGQRVNVAIYHLLT
jgi:hypothetical protein